MKEEVIRVLTSSPMSGNEIFQAVYPDAPKDLGGEWEDKWDEVQSIVDRWLNVREKNADKITVTYADGRPKFSRPK